MSHHLETSPDKPTEGKKSIIGDQKPIIRTEVPKPQPKPQPHPGGGKKN